MNSRLMLTIVLKVRTMTGQPSPILSPELVAGVDAAFEQADREQMTAAIQKALFRQNASETYDALFSNEHADKTR